MILTWMQEIINFTFSQLKDFFILFGELALLFAAGAGLSAAARFVRFAGFGADKPGA